MKTQVFKGKNLSRTKVKNNILKIWDLTSEEDRFDWYSEAFNQAIEIIQSPENSLSQDNQTINKVCGVIAALSPVKRWEENIKCATEMINTGNCGHIKLFKDKAINIMSGDGDEDFILDTLSGNKIQSFYKNIRYPKDESCITIDRHALSIALGYWIDETDYQGMTTAQYKFFEDCFKQAAIKKGVTPLKMQSATWVKWRKIKSDYKKV